MSAALRIASIGWTIAWLGCGLPLPVARSQDSATVVRHASEANWALVRQALDAGLADVNAALPDGTTALHWVVHHDATELALRLIDVGADVSVVSRDGITPLALACTNGNTELVTRLLAAGADPETRLPGGETVLMTAARTGIAGPVRALLQRGANVEATERQGQTALMWAAAEGNHEVLELLLEAGADHRVEVRSGFNALFFAVREGRAEVVQRLLRAGADVNAWLQPAGRKGPTSGVGTTALLLAVENGHLELAAALLDAGADANAAPAGYAALHAVTWLRKPLRGDGDPPPAGSGRLNSSDFVRQLVSSGADIELRLARGTSGRGRFTTTGATPFLLAARASDLPLLRLLQELGADPRVPNADHSPPLLAAAGVGALGDGDEAAGTEPEALATIEFLLESGANVNAVDDNGETALHGAAYQSWPQVVRLLAARDADVAVWNRPNRWGWTPLMIAEGHRPGNFRPAPETIAAVKEVMLAAGVTPPTGFAKPPTRNEYSSDNQPQRPQPSQP